MWVYLTDESYPFNNRLININTGSMVYIRGKDDFAEYSHEVKFDGPITSNEDVFVTQKMAMGTLEECVAYLHNIALDIKDVDARLYRGTRKDGKQ